VVDRGALERAAELAIEYVGSVPERPVAPAASLEELREALDLALPTGPTDAVTVIEELAGGVEPGLLQSSGGRFFGFVIGGVLPSALAADWLTSAWDQNNGLYVCAPAASVVEEVAGRWAKELLGLPAHASFAFVTGCQMAHTTALASARHKLLRERGWDVEAKGLSGAPPLRILTTENRHESILRSARLLGVGTDAIVTARADNSGRIEMRALEQALRETEGAPTVVCLQAGDLNTGVFDPFGPACDLAHAAKAWVHVDGAFGLWAAVSDRHRHLLAGVQNADSWATDGHKWLNLPFDSGLPTEQVRNQKDWNPEWSRRGRGFPFYAAVRALGRAGIAELVDRCCAHAERLVREIGRLEGAEIVAAPVINQGLVRFLSKDGDHDRFTDRVIHRIQDDGVAWFGGVTWRGMRVMRVSVCNWLTSDDDIDRTVESVRKVLAS
jgi:glutamate/tyrosine decarboxylase-like PLP-dependent enzyme